MGMTMSIVKVFYFKQFIYFIFLKRYYNLDLENNIVDTGRKRLILNYFLKMFGIYLGMVMFAYIMPGHGAPHIFV